MAFLSNSSIFCSAIGVTGVVGGFVGGRCGPPGVERKWGEVKLALKGEGEEVEGDGERLRERDGDVTAEA